MSTNQQNKSIGETIQGVVDSIVEKGEAAVEMVKEWTGVEIIDDIDQLKKKAAKGDANQVHLKEEMQHELTSTHEPEKPVAIKEEYKEQRDVIEKAHLINASQADKKEEVLQELTKENKAVGAFDDKSMVDKVKEKFDSISVNDAMDKAKEVYGTTTTMLSEKTGQVVDKVKEMTGIVDATNPEYIKSKAIKTNPEQAQMKHAVQRELLSEQKEAEPVQISEEFEQKQRVQNLQKELLKENKETPAFDAKTSTMDKAKDLLDTTTNTIAEKSANAVDKVKEWTGIKDTKESVQQIKDKAVDANPEQAHMKQEMQKELLQQ